MRAQSHCDTWPHQVKTTIPETGVLLAHMCLVLVAEFLNSGPKAIVDMAKDYLSAAVLITLMMSAEWLTLAGPVLWGL
jgi:diacylglycerol kinase